MARINLVEGQPRNVFAKWSRKPDKHFQGKRPFLPISPFSDMNKDHYSRGSHNNHLCKIILKSDTFRANVYFQVLSYLLFYIALCHNHSAPKPMQWVLKPYKQVHEKKYKMAFLNSVGSNYLVHLFTLKSIIIIYKSWKNLVPFPMNRLIWIGIKME